ncbi:MAG: hypothetical protein ABSD75_34105 [Terriglobales bacterium]|jgi:hypothetical protein
MKSRSEIIAAIDVVIAKSEALTRAAERRHAAAVTAAFSGVGFQAEVVTKRAMAKMIAPANSGFRKGSIASQFVDPELDEFHGSPASAANFASDPDGAISHFNAPGGVHGGYDGSAASNDSAFTSAIQNQYPLIDMSAITRPKPMTFEERYSRPTTPRYEPTTGPEFLGPGPVDLSAKANRMTLHKGAGMSAIEKIVYLFDVYATGGSLKAAAAELGIR